MDRTLFRPGQRICCGLSGGADSTALLLALKEANEEKHALGVIVSAIHVHHGLRGDEADADENFVRDLCQRAAVPLSVVRVDTVARRENTREGLEEAARNLRYGAFGAVLREQSADTIATAHTLDDQAETVVMKLLRGAWTDGLSGISPALKQEQHGGKVIRPLLGVRRSEIEAYLRDRDQPWLEDSSNADVSLTRNRVRHELMPMLRSFNPQIDELLANMADIARDEESFWADEAARVLQQVVLPGKPVRGGGRAVSTVVGEKGLSIELERLRNMAPALRRRVVRAAARSLDARLSSEETAKMMALAGFGGHYGVKGVIGSRLELRAGFRVERSARELRLWRAADRAPTLTP